MLKQLSLAFATLVCLTACAGDNQEVVVIRTSMGEIVFAFHEDVPGHVANFRKLAASGFYEETTFHRVIPGFMVQGGDPRSKDGNRGNDGTGDPGYTLPAEIKHQHVLGAVASARKGDRVNPGRASNGSQFYICVEPQPFLDQRFTVFGYVVDGVDVARKIASVPRDGNNNPLDPVVIEKVSLEKRSLTSG